ncbi:unnamed protein product [Trypanosoma congolense IL3000]|uniref:WGS project CAEQ00000000 data, annotated contig 10 n=1 Tax=Trypanosoma congolense (strain IL3000) TaxID=1068625 RepID=F9W3G7_TRYCI|nr:unnamed protein product [Trypanosoma congolense IL3000]
MNDTLRKISWCCPKELFSGERTSPARDECSTTELNEVLPGLYLTCEERICNRMKALEEGITLVLTLNGGDHVSPYRVYSYSGENERYFYEKISSFEEFSLCLDRYTSEGVPGSLLERKVFIRSIAAEDCPLYDISAHFPELCTLIEIVMVNREALGQKPTRLPTVAVHCLMGVSRSAAAVAAYIMKRGKYSKDASIYFLKKARSVVNPNPGFHSQLVRWENGGYYRYSDRLSASIVAAELCNQDAYSSFLEKQLRLLLHERRFVDDRKLFGYVIQQAVTNKADLRLAMLKFSSYISSCIADDVFADVPSFFVHVCEIVNSIIRHVPKMLDCTLEGIQTVFDDLIYCKMFNDISRFGAGANQSLVAKAFCSLLGAMYTKHLGYNPHGRPVSVNCNDTAPVVLPQIVRLTFTFLPFVTPYTAGFAQLYGFTKSAEEEAERVAVGTTDILIIFRRSVVRFGCGMCLHAGNKSNNDSLSHSVPSDRFESDIEISMLEYMERGLTLTTAAEKCISVNMQDRQATLIWMQKIVGGVVGIRFLYDSVDHYIEQNNDIFTGLDSDESIADELAPWDEVSAIVRRICTLYLTTYGDSVDFFSWIRKELNALLTQGIVVIPDSFCLAE